MNERSTPRAKGNVLRARVHIVDYKPKIWRLFEVDSSLYLDEFHDVLQVIKGWENSYLHSSTERNPNPPSRGRI